MTIQMTEKEVATILENHVRGLMVPPFLNIKATHCGRSYNGGYTVELDNDIPVPELNEAEAA